MMLVLVEAPTAREYEVRRAATGLLLRNLN